MKEKVTISTLLLVALFLTLAPTTMASTTWYVNGVSANDSNNCRSSQAPCRTIGHAISLASSGDTIMVAVATYKEHLTINISLNVLGAGASTKIIDGGGTGRVITINSASVILSMMTVRNGFSPGYGGGISNNGTLTINNSTVSGNAARDIGSGPQYDSSGGGISSGTVRISNSTISGNSAHHGGGIANGGTAEIQNSILANGSAGNCSGVVTSNGYNMSSDGTCNFSNSGDRNNTNPMLGTLGNYGGPTQTIPLLSGSPAIDAGNPSGCTDGSGHLLTTDQRGRGYPRPDKEDTGGCDMGAFERQSDY